MLRMLRFGKNSLKSVLLLLVIGQTVLCLQAQDSRVESGSFRFMLKSLLDHSVPEIAVAEAAQAGPGAIFLDARERAEFEVSHIRGAHFVGYDHFELANVSTLAKDTPIIVYCSVGYRSEKVAEQLIAAGYQNVSNLYGGVFEWKNQDQQVVDMQEQETEAVHAFSRSWGIWLKEGKKVY